MRPIPSVHPKVWDAYFWVADAEALFEEFTSRGARVHYAPMLKPYDVVYGAVAQKDVIIEGLSHGDNLKTSDCVYQTSSA